MAQIVIIGAGLTGLSAAYHLEQRGFTDYKLFEKEPTVGGLCRSEHQDGFTFDYTGHLLHASDPYFQNLLEDLVGLDNFESIYRKSFIYSHETFTRYPFQVNLFGLPEEVIVECIEGYVKRKKTRRKNLNFPEWVLEHFGSGIAKNFFFPFQKKILAYDLKKITSTWMGRFVPKTSLQQMISGAIKDKVETDIGYNAHFYYPKKGGIQHWINKLAGKIQNPIHTDFCVEKVDLKNKVISFTNGAHEHFDTLITTMPLDYLLKNTVETATTRLKKALPHLECNSVVNLNYGIAREHLSDRHWIYFPESEYPFYRLGFPHNFSKHMAPEGCSSIYAEFSHVNAPPAKVKRMLNTARKSIKKFFKLQEREILTECVINISHAYVLYTFWREKHLPHLLKRLEEQSVHSVGRYGAWKYSSMQEAILDGKSIAEKLTVMPAVKAYYHTVDMPTEQSKELT